MRGRRRRRARGVSSTALAVVGGLAVVGSYLAVRTGRSRTVDEPLEAVLTRPRGAAVDRAVGVATDLGSVYGAAGVAAALARTGHRRRAVEVAAAAGAAWLGAQAVKPLLGRQRPYELGQADRLVAVPAGSSWPSGHAGVAAAMATVLAPHLPPPARGAAGLVVAAVGASRCYVGVHHPTDVVAGAGVGVLAALGARRLLGRR